jgi:hypothetical protein
MLGRRRNELALPRGSATAARLEFARGASRVTIGGRIGMDDLVRARFAGMEPMVLAHDGRVTIEYPLASPSEWLTPNRRAADVALNASVPWELIFSGGVSRLRADLRDVVLRSLEIARGASDVEVDLPEPQGIVSVRIGGGASKVTIRRPAGVGARVSIEGSSVVHGSIAAHGASTSRNRFEIELGGGASEVTIS